MHPLQGGQFHGFPDLPRSTAVNQLGLAQPVDGLAKALSWLSPLLPTDGSMPASTSRSEYRMLTYYAPRSLRHIKLLSRSCWRAYRARSSASSTNSVRHRTTHSPADDAPGKHIDDEGYVQTTLPGRDVSEVADPQLIGSPGMQLPVNPVQRTRRLCITDRGARHISTHHTAQAHAAHQSLDSTTRRCHTFACQLPPHLVGTIHLHIGLPDAFNLRHKCLVAMSPGAALVRLAQQRCMSSVSRRDNLQDLAERLDPEGIALLVNKGSHNFSRRSSYAGAKNALVSFSISLDRRSSLISRTSSLTC